MYDKIIPLGSNCGITFTLQYLKLKKETSLFEWCKSDTLEDINNVIKDVYENNNKELIFNLQERPGVSIGTSNRIISYHYKLSTFTDIFIRRAERFINNLKNDEVILFIRFEIEIVPVTEKELDDFIDIIKSINPNKKFSLLLISSIDNETDFQPIIKNHVINKFILKSDYKDDPTLSDNPRIYKKIKNILNEVGYNTQNLIHTRFNDHSIN